MMEESFIQKFTEIFNSTTGQKEVTRPRLEIAQVVGILNRLDKENDILGEALRDEEINAGIHAEVARKAIDKNKKLNAEKAVAVEILNDYDYSDDCPMNGCAWELVRDKALAALEREFCLECGGNVDDR